jgi:non-heme chloroperoxidase
VSYLTTPDGTRLRYTDRGPWEGGGEGTIVLVHGWKGSHRLWDPAVMRLAARFRVIAFDNRGMGESDKPVGPYDFDVLADDLGFLLGALEVREATLIGWSMGCPISLQLLERRDAAGERVARLGLLNGPVRVRNTEGFEWGMDEEQLDGYFEEVVARWPESERDLAREANRDPDSAFADLYYRVGMQTPLEMAVRLLHAQTPLDHRAILRELEIPVLAMVGGHDPYYEAGLAHWIAAEARDGRAVIFEQSAHAPQYDEADRFAAVIGAFARGTAIPG